jgi:ADP-heptose:LPS heptosyltransferase
MNHCLVSLRRFVRDGGGRKLLSLFKGLLSEPRYIWEFLTGFPQLAIRHLLLREPIFWVHRGSGIGDIICTLPAVVALRHIEPKAIIIYETRRTNLPIVMRCRSVDLVVEEGSPLARIARKVFALKMYLNPLLPDEYVPQRHCARIHLSEEFGRSFGFPTLKRQSVCLEVIPKANKEVRKWLQNEGLQNEESNGAPLVVIHTGPSWKTREWPIEHWLDLVGRLQAEFNARVVQIGHDSYQSGEASPSPRVTGTVDWVGKLSIDHMLALLKVTDLFVGIDSGMLHLAGAVRTPCVGIFGPTDSNCRLPACSPAVGVTAQVPCIGCHHNADGPGHWRMGCVHDVRCMSNLGGEDVFRACSQLLKTPRRPEVRAVA